MAFLPKTIEKVVAVKNESENLSILSATRKDVMIDNFGKFCICLLVLFFTKRMLLVDQSNHIISFEMLVLYSGIQLSFWSVKKKKNTEENLIESIHSRKPS